MTKIVNCKLDLDATIKEYNLFDKNVTNQQLENATLREEKEQLKSFITKQEREINELKQDIGAQKKLVDTLQQALNQRCDSQDKNRELSQNIDNLRIQLEAVKREKEEEILNHEKHCVALRDQHEKDMRAVRQELQEQAEKEMKEWSRVTEAQEQTIEQLKRKLCAAEAERQQQVRALTSQYESQISTLQKQNAKTATAATMQDRELYRKKLHQTRVESQKEISELKSALSSLQQQLAFYEQPVSKPKPGRSARFTNR